MESENQHPADIQIQPEGTYTTNLRGITKTHATLKEAITEIQTKAKAWDSPIPCTITTKEGTWPAIIPQEGNPKPTGTPPTPDHSPAPAAHPGLGGGKIVETIPLKPL